MRRGLSPLVATIVLIAFTVLGGILVYEFFMKTSESLMASGERLLVTATKSYFDNTRLLVELEVVNGYRTNVTIQAIRYVTATATVTSAQMVYGNVNVDLVPGAKYKALILVPTNTKAVLIEYRVRDQTLTEAVPLG